MGRPCSEKIAEQFNRSSRTPLLHIQRHNRDVERIGFCTVCKRVGSKNLEDIVAKK